MSDVNALKKPRLSFEQRLETCKEEFPNWYTEHRENGMSDEDIVKRASIQGFNENELN